MISLNSASATGITACIDITANYQEDMPEGLKYRFPEPKIKT